MSNAKCFLFPDDLSKCRSSGLIKYLVHIIPSAFSVYSFYVGYHVGHWMTEMNKPLSQDLTVDVGMQCHLASLDSQQFQDVSKSWPQYPEHFIVCHPLSSTLPSAPSWCYPGLSCYCLSPGRSQQPPNWPPRLSLATLASSVCCQRNSQSNLLKRKFRSRYSLVLNHPCFFHSIHDWALST